MKKTQQKGAAGITALLVILVLGALIFGYYWSTRQDESEVPNITRNNLQNNTTENEEDLNNNNSVLNPDSSNNTPTSAPTVITTTSEVFPGGIEYSLPYGLTMAFPASWAPYAITKQSPSYGGVTPTDSTTITLPDGPVLTINTFTKEQWNRIKTQENAANQNTPSLGEGEYLGENSTYIYSYIILGRESEVRSVLRNIISF